MFSKARSQSRQQPWVRTGLCLVVGIIVVVALAKESPWLYKAEHYLQDRLARTGRTTARNPDLVLIGFNKGQYAQGREGDTAKSRALELLRAPFPWSREVWADVIERVMGAGAKGVVLDLVFPGARDGNDQLAAVLNKYKGRAVVGYQVMEADKDSGEGTALLLPDEIVPAGDHGTEHDVRSGFVNIWPDSDGVARSARFRISETSFLRRLKRDEPARPGEPHMESLSARALRILGHADKIPEGEESLRFRYTSTGKEADAAFTVIELDDLFAENYWNGNLKGGQFFKDKLVLVGPTGDIFHDTHPTPMSDTQLPGPIIHLNIINAALRGEFIRVGMLDVSVWIAAGALAAAIALSWLVRSALLRFVLSLVFAAAIFGAVAWVFEHRDMLVLTASPMIIIGLSGMVTMGYDFRVEREARKKLRATMDLYFSPKVSAYVLANPGSMEARSAEVTLLLTDLRNSTPLAEKLGPAGMFSLLNHVFEVETNAVMGQDGALEHFLGDQFLTYWGAPQPQPDGPNQALRAAMELIRGMEVLKAVQTPEVKALFGYGVALHCGSVLFGNKGSARRLDFGLVGDTINEAARMESLTKYYGVTLLVSRECFTQLTSPGPHRLLDRVIVKGKSTPVELFEIENPRTPPDYAGLVKEWDVAFAGYTAGRFSEARPVFARLAEQFNDGPSKVMVHRCDELTASPHADWKGVWKMESK
ncbi:MAG: adenylate/guanylate cyclase domain-containing protein [Limisphaerales bacterium]